jgi:hypothetical protein
VPYQRLGIVKNMGKCAQIPVAARSKASVCGPSPAEIVGSNSTDGGLSVVGVVFCQVKASATS